MEEGGFLAKRFEGAEMVASTAGWSSQGVPLSPASSSYSGAHFEEFANRTKPRVLGFPKVAVPEPVTLSCNDSRAWLNVVVM